MGDILIPCCVCRDVPDVAAYRCPACNGARKVHDYQAERNAARAEAADLRKRVEGLMGLLTFSEFDGDIITDIRGFLETHDSRPSAVAAVWAALGMTPLEPREGE